MVISRHWWGALKRLTVKASDSATGLVRNTEASVLPMVAGAMTMLLGTTGMAVDGARIYYVRDVLQRSLDAAGLAAGNAADLDNLEADAHRFFDANFSAAGGIASAGDLVLEISDDNRLISLSATARIAPTFMAIFGFDSFDIAASTQITRETRGMELVLVADVTGSMAGHRIRDLRKAANHMVDVVYGEEETAPNLMVGVVPYITTVNIGSHRTNWLSEAGKDMLAFDEEHEEYVHFGPDDVGWKGCVMAREDGEDLTDSVPSTAPFVPYLWPSSNENEWREGDGPGDWDYEINEDAGYKKLKGRGPNVACPSEILPLVAEKSTIKDKIEDLEPWFMGGTSSAMGLAWGWRMVSPKWRGLFGGDTPDGHPVDYDDDALDKVVVVLTDGGNGFATGGKPDGGSHFTAYGRADDFAGSNDAVVEEINTRFSKVCTAMKDEGIIIYSITFGTAIKYDTQQLFQACATNSSFHFHAPSGGDLDDAFDTIGRQLSNLRLSS